MTEQKRRTGAETQAGGIGAMLINLLRAREAALVIIVLTLFVGLSFLSPYFLTWGNIRAVILSFSTEGIVVVGMTILLIAGGFDLSVGAVMALSMAVAARLTGMGMNVWLASLGGLGAAAMVGAWMGIFVTRIGLNFFVVSLAMLGIVRGLAFVVTNGAPLPLRGVPEAFSFIGQGRIYGFPFAIMIFLVIIVLGDVLLRYSRFMRLVIYTGSNERAAIFSGVDTRKVKFWATVLCSSLAGLAGLIFMSKFGSATPTFGVGSELNIIAAAIIGGASLNGGRGSVLGAILGIALLSLVTNGMILLSIPVFWQETTRGSILLVAVTVDHLVTSRSR